MVWEGENTNMTSMNLINHQKLKKAIQFIKSLTLSTDQFIDYIPLLKSHHYQLLLILYNTCYLYTYYF